MAYETGKQSRRGGKNSMSKLTEEDVRMIRKGMAKGRGLKTTWKKTTKKKAKKLSYYKKQAWDSFSRFVRTRDCIATTKKLDKGKCVTCGLEFDYSDLQAGHAQGGRNNSILIDEELVNAQCRGCNGYGNGRYAEYSIWFIERYGLDRWKEKTALRKTTVIYKKHDYIDIKEKYDKKYNDLLEAYIKENGEKY